MKNTTNKPTPLLRSLSLFQLTFYGIGTILVLAFMYCWVKLPKSAAWPQSSPSYCRQLSPVLVLILTLNSRAAFLKVREKRCMSGKSDDSTHWRTNYRLYRWQPDYYDFPDALWNGSEGHRTDSAEPRQSIVVCYPLATAAQAFFKTFNPPQLAHYSMLH